MPQFLLSLLLLLHAAHNFTSTVKINTTAAPTTVEIAPTPSPAATRKINTTTAAALTPAPSPLAINTSTTATPNTTFLAPKPSSAAAPNSTSAAAANYSATPLPAVKPNATTASVIAAPPPSPLPRSAYRQQLNNIIDALIGAGDFNVWANVLSAADPSFLPLSATLFIPSDDSRSPIATTTTVDPYIFPYHIVPQRLSFSNLVQLKLHSRIPTLLVAKTIIVTNNSISNYTLDGSLVSHPDLFSSGNFAVHGINTLLDYSVYGDAYPKVSQPEVLSRPPEGMIVSEGEWVGDQRPETNSACLCSEVWTVLWILCAVLTSKIRNLSLFGN